MIKPGKHLGAVLLAGAVLMLSYGCQKHEGPAEQAGKKLDQAAEQIGQKVEQAGSNLKDAAKGDKK